MICNCLPLPTRNIYSVSIEQSISDDKWVVYFRSSTLPFGPILALSCFFVFFLFYFLRNGIKNLKYPTWRSSRRQPHQMSSKQVRKLLVQILGQTVESGQRTRMTNALLIQTATFQMPQRKTFNLHCSSAAVLCWLNFKVVAFSLMCSSHLEDMSQHEHLTLSNSLTVTFLGSIIKTHLPATHMNAWHVSYLYDTEWVYFKGSFTKMTTKHISSLTSSGKW